MRVLWLSMNPGLYGAKGGNDSYNGGGWISSLQRIVQDDATLEIGLAFITESPLPTKTVKKTTYFPILQKKSAWQKLAYYYGGYKKDRNEDILENTLRVINSFQPEIIHLFGLEGPFSSIIGKTNRPVIVHIQGLLGPVHNAYWPSSISSNIFIWPPRIEEWILRNGVDFMYKFTKQKAEKELIIHKQVNYAMGRTSWDKHITHLLAPQARYFHVDEVLRNSFYRHAGEWTYQEGTLQIISTISHAPYKGLDLILKTANLLKKIGIDFIWKVVGITSSASIISTYERKLNIESSLVGITYTGILSEDSLCKEIISSTIYVHPSYIDNSPNSLCEAQMLGIPCISTNVGGTSSLIQHEKDGILVPANGTYELAYYIQHISSNKELMATLSKEGSTTASKRHNKQSILLQLLTTYKNLI